MKMTMISNRNLAAKCHVCGEGFNVYDLALVTHKNHGLANKYYHPKCVVEY